MRRYETKIFVNRFHIEMLQVHHIGINIFIDKTYENICPSIHNMNVPNVKRVEYSVKEADLGQEIRTKFENGDGVKKP